MPIQHKSCAQLQRAPQTLISSDQLINDLHFVLLYSEAPYFTSSKLAELEEPLALKELLRSSYR